MTDLSNFNDEWEYDDWSDRWFYNSNYSGPTPAPAARTSWPRLAKNIERKADKPFLKARAAIKRAQRKQSSNGRKPSASMNALFLEAEDALEEDPLEEEEDDEEKIVGALISRIITSAGAVPSPAATSTAIAAYSATVMNPNDCSSMYSKAICAEFDAINAVKALVMSSALVATPVILPDSFPSLPNTEEGSPSVDRKREWIAAREAALAPHRVAARKAKEAAQVADKARASYTEAARAARCAEAEYADRYRQRRYYTALRPSATWQAAQRKAIEAHKKADAWSEFMLRAIKNADKLSEVAIKMALPHTAYSIIYTALHDDATLAAKIMEELPRIRDAPDVAYSIIYTALHDDATFAARIMEVLPRILDAPPVAPPVASPVALPVGDSICDHCGLREYDCQGSWCTYETDICSFCHRAMPDCPEQGDHSAEMREICAEQLRSYW